MSTRRETTLDEVLDFVKSSRGFDFTGYKRASVQRRLRKRMEQIGIEHYDEYVDYLELNGDEFVALFNTLLIHVTSFYRDPDTWRYLATNVIPELVGQRPTGPLRLWCAGCSTGEEAYTLAMVLIGVIGEAEFGERVKIYATDIDDDALETARRAVYPERALEGVPAAERERFFERAGPGFVFRKDLRRCIIFGRNDLIGDAPISRIDLLTCRNTLMYMNAEAQAQILRRFHFALADDGVLLLGRSEMLITHSALFTPVDLRWRAFRKVLTMTLADRVRVLAADPDDGASLSVGETLREAAFDAGDAAEIVLDGDHSLVMANAEARRLFGIGIGDYGRPLQTLELAHRPLELRGHLEALAREPRVINLEPIRFEVEGVQRAFTVRVAPLVNDGVLMGASVVYEDQSRLVALSDEMTATQRALGHAHEELQSAVEELETTNEELQSTNEELETTNEELQSTNEELETMNEELQSTNEELETMNDELRHRTLELNEMNGFFEAMLITVGFAVAVLDRAGTIKVWNDHARELWGLTADEVAGQEWLALDIGLPVRRVAPMIDASLTGASEREETTLDAINRRGRAFRCRVITLPLRSGRADGEPSGAIVMMDAAA